MGFKRDVANVMSLGAFSRVEEAKDSYDLAVWQYNNHKRDIDDYIKGIEVYSQAIETAQKALEQNREQLNKISQDQTVVSRLTSQEKDSLKQYMATNAVASCTGLQRKKRWDLECSGFEHDSDMEGSAIGTCVMFPVLAQILINSEASKQIESINSQKSKVITATEELSKKVAEVAKVYEKSKQALNMISVVMDIVINSYNSFYRGSQGANYSALIDAKENAKKARGDKIHSEIEHNRTRKRDKLQLTEGDKLQMAVTEAFDTGNYNVVNLNLSDIQ